MWTLHTGISSQIIPAVDIEGDMQTKVAVKFITCSIWIGYKLMILSY